MHYNETMKSNATTFEAYVDELPPERKEAFSKLLATVRANIDPKFEETVLYGMIGWAIPKTIYPAGYHVNPSLPVSFLGLANQKNYIALYHMGLYADAELLKWFEDEYAKTGEKLDMGKSCIRFKNASKLPYELIGQLASRMTLDDYLALYVASVPGDRQS